MPETKQQVVQGLARPALKPFVRPLVDEPRPALRPAAPAFGRVTLPPFGPIRYGGPKPGEAPTAHREDEEEPTWASIEEYAHTAPAQEVAEPESESELAAAELEPEPYVAAQPVPELEAEEAAPETVPEPEPLVASAAPVEDDTGLFDEELPPPPVVEQRDEPMPWEAAPEPEPEPVMRRPVLPLTGPSDPTPIMNPAIERTIERTTEPHRMTPMRVTPLRPSVIPSTPTPTFTTSMDSNARAIAAALEMVAARVRRGDLVVTGSMPSNDDPPALAAVLAATAAALLGVRS